MPHSYKSIVLSHRAVEGGIWRFFPVEDGSYSRWFSNVIINKLQSKHILPVLMTESYF